MSHYKQQTMEEINIENEFVLEEGATGMNLTQEEIKKRVEDCVKELQSAQGRLEELQDACRHPNLSVELLNRSLRTCCKDCGLAIGYPTAEQKRLAGYLS